jgi:hypothetical protein
LRHAGGKATRLRAQFPDLAEALHALSNDERAGLVQRVAFDAARVTGLLVPEGSIAEIEEWAAEVDGSGWTTDSTGEPVQDQASFARARAAFAVRDARVARERPAVAAESLYESVMAIGLHAVEARLGLASS